MERKLNEKEVEDLIFDGNISDLEDLIDDNLQDGQLNEGKHSKQSLFLSYTF